MHKIFIVLNQYCEAGNDGYRAYLKFVESEIRENPNFSWDYWCFVAYFSQKEDLSRVSLNS